MIRNFKIIDGEKRTVAFNQFEHTYTVWVPQENRTLFVHINDDETKVATVDYFNHYIDVNTDDATLLTINNCHWCHDNVLQSPYARLAAKCYLDFMTMVNFADIAVVTESCYSEETDRTFIMEHTLINNDSFLSEVVGWYCGEPTDDYTKEYSNHMLLSFY